MSKILSVFKVKYSLNYVLFIMILTNLNFSLAQEEKNALNGSFWKEQALKDIIPYWTKYALDKENGAFTTNLDREWKKVGGTEKFPSMISRHVFSYSVAYLLTGEEKYIKIAKEAVNFLLARAWDKKYGGWYDELDKKGKPVKTSKNTFVQAYAATGLAMYYFVTHDENILKIIEKTNDIFEANILDNINNGYYGSLNQDLSVKIDGKDFASQVAPVSGYMIYLYLATRDDKYSSQMLRVMNIVSAVMQDSETKWILENFDREWKSSQNDEVSIGHNIETAWMLLRLSKIVNSENYVKKAKELSEKIMQYGFDKGTGAWFNTVKNSNPEKHGQSSIWWIQAYGNMFQLFLYHITNDKKYLDNFESGAKFWNQYMTDKEYGDTYLSVGLDGKMNEGTKANQFKASYHNMEHCLLNYLYLDLWVNRKSVELNFIIDSPADRKLYPVPIEDRNIQIKKVLINDKEWTDFDPKKQCINLPKMKKMKVKVIF
jgi:cellobiose epimerase